MTTTNWDISRDDFYLEAPDGLGKADPRSPQREAEVIVSFTGPFSWFCNLDAPSIYDTAEALKAGVYLWTVPLTNVRLIAQASGIAAEVRFTFS
jgi:hypothetical protein